MTQILILCTLLCLLQLQAPGQRSGRRPSSSPTDPIPCKYPGRYFNLTLSNNDSEPILLKLGPITQIEDDDTLILFKNTNCNFSNKNFYYDLHDVQEWETSCITWYTLQLIQPGQTIRFVVKLNDFDSLGSSKLFYCYTRQIIATDQQLGMYADRSKIILQKCEGRDFETSYLALNKNIHSDDHFINLKSSKASTERSIIHAGQ
ncbi:hypothetical protein LZZ85_20715 [Terrimonas sp. NA20]|uniref:CUB domain-containing protein n=1 Tax=Terrimonas ginsenosidimutans TaxID=2908004 RepID=A0ABS9KWX3_9BACT|nr:hypothetical protein [Terrimonas ginsenosidimutans]MCG2616734.1 hypothetical protein [Terrimonas ginsenosidimutans]